eukprot:9598710-Alexandrium_andersonii.AAC.1
MLGDLIPVPKDKARVRAVVVPNFVRKVAMAAVHQLCLDDVRRGVGWWQFGVGVPDGAVRAYEALSLMRLSRPDHVEQLDASNAHSSIRRDVLGRILGQRSPRSQQVLRQWYGRPSRRLWRGSGAPEE